MLSFKPKSGACAFVVMSSMIFFGMSDAPMPQGSASASSAQQTDIFEQIRQKLVGKTSFFPKLKDMTRDVPELVKHITSWLDSSPEFKDPKVRNKAYDLLRHEKVASDPAAAAALLKGLNESSEMTRVTCAWGLKYAPAGMRYEVRAAIRKALAEQTFSDSARNMINREFGLDEETMPFVPTSPIDRELWAVISLPRLDRSDIADIATEFGTEELVAKIKDWLDRSPPVLNPQTRLNAYAALTVPPLTDSLDCISLLGSGIQREEPEVQITCARGLLGVAKKHPDLILSTFANYLENGVPNLEADLLLFEKIYTAALPLTPRVAKAAANRISQFPADLNHSSYCAALILAELEMPDVVATFKNINDVNVLKGIAYGINRWPSRPSPDNTPSQADLNLLREFIFTLMLNEDPNIRECGLTAIWGAMGGDPYARTPEQATINKLIVDTVSQAEVLTNTPAGVKMIRILKASFDENYFLKSKSAIRSELPDIFNRNK
ncbi:MAG: hypothetical protein SGI88_15465 [Candidatus Hydrogenedentes bacterium]|nr:hypothetical protein [Candidatus Hydrogenedentota bacterium]